MTKGKVPDHLTPFAKENDQWLKGLQVRRIKNVGELRQIFRRMSAKASKVAFELLDHDDAKIRLTAAQIILDRGWGKASSQDPETSENLAQAHLEALRAITAGAGATVVTAEDQERIRRDLERLPKLSGVIVVQDDGTDDEEINDNNDLDDDEVK